jgi:hypothetical protein
VIDSEGYVMGDAIRLDDRAAPSILALMLIEHVGHRQDGFQCIALRATGRRDVGFA